MHVNVCLCKYECKCVCMYVCMHACMHACTDVCMYVCMYVCMPACKHACTDVCMPQCLHACKHAMCVCHVRIYEYSVVPTSCKQKATSWSLSPCSALQDMAILHEHIARRFDVQKDDRPCINVTSVHS